MKNTEIGFYSFKQYSSLDVYMDIYRCTSDVIEILLKYFVFFPCTWKIKLLNTSKTKVFWQFQITFHMLGTYVIYLDIGRGDYDDYDGEESSGEDYYE